MWECLMRFSDLDMFADNGFLFIYLFTFLLLLLSVAGSNIKRDCISYDFSTGKEKNHFFFGLILLLWEKMNVSALYTSDFEWIWGHKTNNNQESQMKYVIKNHFLRPRYAYD